VEVLDAGLVRLDGHGEAFFEEDDQLECADRVEDAAGDERRVLGQRVRVLSGQELAEDVVANGALDFLHEALSLRVHSMLPKPAASKRSNWGSVSTSGRAPKRTGKGFSNASCRTRPSIPSGTRRSSMARAVGATSCRLAWR